jgi:Tol biopolymer transport system component
MGFLRPIAVLAAVVAGCAGNAPTAPQSAPVGSPVDTVTPTPAGVAHAAPAYGLAANGPIVYGENGDIYFRDLEAGTSSLLIGGPEVDVGPSFSRDGRRLSFVRVIGENPETIALMIADADGSNVRMVVEPELVGERHWFEWSPSSDVLVLVNSADGVPPLSVVNVVGEPERRAINLAAEVHIVDWQPDTDELIFLGRVPEASGGGRGFYAVGVDGDGLRELVPAPSSGTHTGPFSLSPDGRFLAYTFVNAAGHVSSHVLDLDSGETRTLGGSSNQAWATFSPDGERLALVRYAPTGASAQAYVGSAGGDGTDAVAMGPEVQNQPGHHGLRIQLSPDGTKLLIVHARGGGAWIADVATGEYESVALGDDEWVSWRRLAP